MDALSKLFLGFFGFLDRVVYYFMIQVYELMMQIAGQKIFSDDIINKFSTRIYTLLGIFMGLKLIFSFINYVVNPDSMTESNTGGTKLVINIIVSLVLLLAVPSFIFPAARQLQKNILEDNLLEKLILGIKGDIYSSAGTGNKDNVKRTARMTSYLVFSSFFYPKPCQNIGITFYRDDDPNIKEDFESQDADNQNYRYKLNGDCAQAIVDNVKNQEQGYKAILQYEKAYNQYKVDWLLSEYGDGDDLKDLKDKNGEKLFEYTFLISTAVGIAVTWMFFTFCFQFAVRAIKLAFLQLIAPIPILSYIDSKTKKTFDNWVKACISTFADLFVRLAGLYFAVFTISVVASEDFVIEGNILVNLFIIIGALMFANQLSKLIDDIFGTKLGSAKFSLNPLKNSPLANAVVGGAIGAAGAGLVSASGNLYANHKERVDLRKKRAAGELDYSKLDNRQRKLISDNAGLRGLSAAGAVFGGLGGGIGRGVVGAVKGKGSAGYGKILSDAAKATGTSRNLFRESNYTPFERAKDKWTDLTRTNYKSGSASRLSDDVKKYQKAVADSKQNEDRIKQMQSSNMQAALTNKRYDSSGNEILTKLRPGEFNKINGYIDPSSLEQTVKFGDFTVDWEEAAKSFRGESDYLDRVYEEYKNDATTRRNLGEGEYLTEREFKDAFDLVVEFHEADAKTKELEKSLKSAQESKDARDKKGK